jgi:hypothetical protein
MPHTPESQFVTLRAKTGICTSMTREELRQHIDSAAPRGGSESRRLASLILGACWPGGPEDRTERAALEWLRHWRPGHVQAELPTCSCATGHCVLCN